MVPADAREDEPTSTVPSSSRAHELRKRVEGKRKSELNKSERAQMMSRKKAAASRSWLQIDSKGNSKVIEADKYAIMKRVSIPARDLRILDPLLSYPSTILGREKAIVVNLDQIKCIITAEEVLLLNWKNRIVANLVKELKYRLPLHFDALGEQVAGDGGGGLSDSEIKAAVRSTKRDKRISFYPFIQKPAIGLQPNQIQVESQIKPNMDEEFNRMRGPNALPFEFRALEACLESACGVLDGEANLLENEAQPVLDELTSTISTLNLEKVRQIKSRLVAISGSVQKVRDELEQLLDDDEDMREMYLTDKLYHNEVESDSSMAEGSSPSSPSSYSTPPNSNQNPTSLDQHLNFKDGKNNHVWKEGKVDEVGEEKDGEIPYMPLEVAGKDDVAENRSGDEFDRTDEDDELSKGLLDSPTLRSPNSTVRSSPLHLSQGQRKTNQRNSKINKDSIHSPSSSDMEVEEVRPSEELRGKGRERRGDDTEKTSHSKILPRFESIKEGGRRSRPTDVEKDRDRDREKDDESSISSKTRSSSSRSSRSGKHLDVEELEMLLEAYFVQIEGTLNKLSSLREYVEDTEDYINIMLDDKQNSLLQMNVMLTLGTLVLSMFIVVTGVFGMNIHNHLFEPIPQNYHVFYYVISGSSVACFLIFMVIVAYCRWKRLIDM